MIPFSRKKVYEILRKTINGEPSEAILIVSEDAGKIVGVFLAATSEITFSEEKVATELAFWLLPGYRKSRRVLDLITAFEYWAKNIAKVSFVILSQTPLQDSTERSYKRLGYTNIENNYLKKI
jgi:hypothetical protein